MLNQIISNRKSSFAGHMYILYFRTQKLNSNYRGKKALNQWSKRTKVKRNLWGYKERERERETNS